MNQKFNLALAYWIGYIVFLCFYFYWNKIGEYRDSERVTGIVIDQLFGAGRKWKGRGETGYYPQFEFSYKDSTYVSADRKNIWTRNKTAGAKIKLIFPKDKPGDAVPYTFLSYWISFPILLLSFMIAFFIFMVPVMLGQYAAFKREYPNK